MKNEQTFPFDDGIKVPRFDKFIIWIVILLITSIVLILIYVPWIQTAFGTGSVTTLNPGDRLQPISALVPGQIRTWHVREGQSVKKGDPIVTLIDIDEGRLEKLTAQLNATSERHQANLIAVANAERNLNRQQELLKEGLVSPRTAEAAQIKVQELRAKASKTEEDINKVNMILDRQSTQTKVAPQDGTISRLISAGSSSLVSPGDVLAWFIPDGVKRVVMIKVNGLDASLIHKGRKVRIEFEGWPVFQFSGWPNNAIGTFGGNVAFVDPVADAQGFFTVWIEPDANQPPWPDETSARLGSRARAWVLLEQVSLGYEQWRQLNNFPPVNPIHTSGQQQ